MSKRPTMSETLIRLWRESRVVGGTLCLDNGKPWTSPHRVLSVEHTGDGVYFCCSPEYQRIRADDARIVDFVHPHRWD